MTMAELSMRHEEEMNRMIEDCVRGVRRRLPNACSVFDVETMGLTIDEVYELSNKFLPKRVLARYIDKEFRIVSARRTDLINIEVDEMGRLTEHGEKRTLKSTRIVYAFALDEYFEEEEELEEED